MNDEAISHFTVFTAYTHPAIYDFPLNIDAYF